MDTGKGTFEELNPEGKSKEEVSDLMKSMQKRNPKHGGWFRQGEIIALKGSRFKVKKIKPTEITLKLLKRKEVK